MGNKAGKIVGDVGNMAMQGVGMVGAAATGNIAGAMEGFKGYVGATGNLARTIARLTADDGDNSGDDVASAVRGLLAEIKRLSGGKFNIVIIRGTNDHDASGIKDTLEEEKELPHPEYGMYKIYIFGSGTFVNKGDGGFSNIAVSGKYTHISGRYNFLDF